MRGLLALVVIVLVLSLIGWISFGNNKNEATITIDKQKVKEDVEKIEETGKALGERIERAVEE